MNIKYEIYIGLNDKDLHKQIFNTRYYIDKIKKQFECCTITLSNGLYKNELEKTFIITLIDNETERKNIYSKVRTLKFLFNQECILITETILNDVKFI